MTPIQACRETKELWTEMARIAREENKAVEKYSARPLDKLQSGQCPCCEYSRLVSATTFCAECPMKEEWAVYGESINASCEDPQSPYIQWLNRIYVEESLCIDVEFFCLLIAEMAEEAIERLIAESQPKMAEDKDIDYVQVNRVKN